MLNIRYAGDKTMSIYIKNTYLWEKYKDGHKQCTETVIF